MACLSDRELEAFELFGQGSSTPQVASKMLIQRQDRGDVSLRVKEKLHLSSVNELVQRSTQWLLERSRQAQG